MSNKRLSIGRAMSNRYPTLQSLYVCPTNLLDCRPKGYNNNRKPEFSAFSAFSAVKIKKIM